MHYTRYHVRLAAYAVIVNDDGEVLLTLWNGRGKHQPRWTLPGGGVEFDEHIRDALVREVFEESGFHIRAGSLIDESFALLPASQERELPARLQRLVFDAEILSGSLGTVEIGGSTDMARWMPLAQARALPHKAEADFLNSALDAFLSHNRP